MRMYIVYTSCLYVHVLVLTRICTASGSGRSLPSSTCTRILMGWEAPILVGSYTGTVHVPYMYMYQYHTCTCTTPCHTIPYAYTIDLCVYRSSYGVNAVPGTVGSLRCRTSPIAETVGNHALASRSALRRWRQRSPEDGT